MMNNTIAAKTEIALMGRVVTMTEKNMADVLDYIGSAVSHREIKGEEILRDAFEFIDREKTEIYGISCSTVQGDPCVNIIFRDKDEDFDLASDEGVLCYVHNFRTPIYSELGYSFFKKCGNTYHRVA